MNEKPNAEYHFRKTAERVVEIATEINEMLLARRQETYFDPDSDYVSNLIDYNYNVHMDSAIAAVKKLGIVNFVDEFEDNIEEITKTEIRGNPITYDDTDVVYAEYIGTPIDQLEDYEVNEYIDCSQNLLWAGFHTAIDLVQEYQLSLEGQQQFGIDREGVVEYSVGHWACRVWDRESNDFRSTLARCADELTQKELLQFIPDDAVSANLDWEGEIRELCFYNEYDHICGQIFERSQPILYVHIAELIQELWEQQPDGSHIA